MLRRKLVFLLAATAYILKLVMICLLAGLFLEGVLRIIQQNYKPIIPYKLDNQIPHLPYDSEFYVSLAGGVKGKYTTDDMGARILSADVRGHSREGDILIVGDSQPMGWGMDFDQTFASRLAAAVTADPGKARILAAPATDPEHFMFAISNYSQKHQERQRASIVVLNLGNDLDEMYTVREGLGVETSSAFTFWLNMHSLLYLDAALLRSKIFGGTDIQTPGINSIFYALLPDEQIVLADQAVRIVLECIKRLPPSDQVIVLITPQDFQIDLSQFDKYRSFYKTEQEFNDWKSRTPQHAEILNSLEKHIIDRFEAEHVKVVSVSSILRQAGAFEGVFDNFSHHLTAKGHQLVADALIPILSQ
jgi:hypothetical protein